MSNTALTELIDPLNFRVLPTETLGLTEAASRIAAEDILALSACPPRSEALRDGYVLGQLNESGIFTDFSAGGAGGQEAGYSYPVIGEIAAGTRNVSILRPGSACRIFTGAVIPEGGVRVVPQEGCQEVAGRVEVIAKAMASERLYIKKAGSEVACGETIVCKGTRLEIDHLTLLAAAGVSQVPVVIRPRVACFCTGSELVAVGGRIETGQKLSLNSLLLQNLIPRYGGIIEEQGIIADSHQAIAGIFGTLTDGHCDLVISTGGMGPGKYDLVKKAFSGAGGRIILESLPMHPGRSMLLGVLGQSVFIALPGPPNAVRTLVNELVGPVILMMQGAHCCWPKALQAGLLQDYMIRKSDLMQVKGGVLLVEQGNCMVRLAERLEPISCFILFAAGRKEFTKGDVVEVHLSTTSTDGNILHF